MSLTALSVPAVLAMGCSSTSPGSPSGSGNGNSSAPADTSSSTKPSSTRPKSIDLKTVDPCQILTPQQRQQVGFETAGTPSNASSVYDRAKMCNFPDISHNLSADYMLVITKGVEAYTDGTLNAQTQPIQVNGFPALIVRTPGLGSACAVDVDVADGQFLEAQFLVPTGDKSQQDMLCQKAQQAAVAAISALAGR